jgi:hypothetical protein
MLWQSSTTWAFVKMSPFAPITTPEPLTVALRARTTPQMSVASAVATLKAALMSVISPIDVSAKAAAWLAGFQVFDQGEVAGNTSILERNS